jgi:hypothetical protein
VLDGAEEGAVIGRQHRAADFAADRADEEAAHFARARASGGGDQNLIVAVKYVRRSVGGNPDVLRAVESDVVGAGEPVAGEGRFAVDRDVGMQPLAAAGFFDQAGGVRVAGERPLKAGERVRVGQQTLQVELLG